MEKATFAAGCFWHVEEVFSKTNGVKSTAVGYTGGHTDNPTYEDVCTDKTGHAEAIQVEFDPTKISYSDLVKVFFENHNPTTPNRQGPDIGIQYRSAIFYHNVEQENIAKEVKEKLNLSAQKTFGSDIVTEIKSASTFYLAEEYHQKYFEKNY
jgi:peptide-methionine (S)-S-oxide reductase